MAEYPHCNTQVIHAPGECYYCDLHPDLQAQRQASGTAFTPNESNGWSGNVAVKAGETHSHMGATYVVGDGPVQSLEVLDDSVLPCRINAFPGWWCSRDRHEDGPCALRPRWWNFRARLRGW